MRPKTITLAALALAFGPGCGLLGMGKKPSPYQGVLRFETDATVRADRPLRVGVRNDSPATETFNPCRDLRLQRFNGLGWTPVAGYTPCATPLSPVTLAPGTGTAIDLAPVPAGTGYRLVLLHEDASATDEQRTGRTRTVQSSTTFTVAR